MTDDRLAMIQTNLDSLLANESNILNIADYEWLIGEVGRLRGAVARIDAFDEANAALGAEVVRLRTALVDLATVAIEVDPVIAAIVKLDTGRVIEECVRRAAVVETPAATNLSESKLAVARAKAAMFESWIREHHPDATILAENIVGAVVRRNVSRHAFHDPVHPHAKVVLVIQSLGEAVGYPVETYGVEHPDCSEKALVSPNIDAYYCSACSWNGRISGAWFMDKWRER